jgi:hypothetical protein
LNQEKETGTLQRRSQREVKAELRIGHCPVAGGSLAWADSLELKNGSLIRGKFMGGIESETSFRVGYSVQNYNLADIVSLKCDSARQAAYDSATLFESGDR